MPPAKTLLTILATMMVSIVSALSINQVLAGPSSSPPYNNVPSPINGSLEAQVKKGPLGLGSLRTNALGGNQLYVRGQTKLEGDTTVVGKAKADQFCLPEGKGGCTEKWNPAGSTIVGSGAMYWNLSLQQTSFYCETYLWLETNRIAPDGTISSVPSPSDNRAVCRERTEEQSRAVTKFLACPTGSRIIEIFRDFVYYDPSIANQDIASRAPLRSPIIRSVYLCVTN